MFIRNINYWRLLELFLVSAISTIILVRFFLEATGYPRLGGSDFHIAHMLWGGLLLTGALIMSITFLSRRIPYFAALCGGIGFGLFIDELGKFITADNNYLYQPTLAIIYVIFIIFFFLFRRIGSHSFSEEEYLVNSIEFVKDGVTGELTDEEKQIALDYLAKVKKSNQGVRLLKLAYADIPTAVPGRIDAIGRYLGQAKFLYRSVVQKKWFIRSIIIFFVLSSLGTLSGLLFLVYAYFFKHSFYLSPDFSSSAVLQSLSSFAGTLFVLVGLFKLRSSRLRAYVFFKRYILIDILISTVFEFYTNQIWAVIGLLFDLILLISLNFMIDSEKELS